VGERKEFLLKLPDLFSTEALWEHIIKGVISRTQHPQFPELWVYNYTHVAQHDNVWDDVTEQCRGLVCRQDTATSDWHIWLLNHQEVIARPFRKFFNLNTGFRPETLEANLPSWKPRVLEKLDGSLGILFHHGWRNEAYIATRGSFASDQAVWATKWYRDKFGNWPIADSASWPKGYTPLFEIIYNENRIVVNYDYQGLVLLGLVNIDTGAELPPEEVVQWASKNGLRVPLEYTKSLEECKSEQGKNMEGFVLQYWNKATSIPLRLKIKTEDYVRLHKVITGLNPKGIWEHLSQGFDQEALWVPALQNKQFVTWCQGWIKTFQDLYAKYESEAITAFGRASVKALAGLRLEKSPDARLIRKHYALAFQAEDSKYQSTFFAMLDGKDYKKPLWGLLEPKIQGKDVYIRDADTNNGI
jgi:RNA ligase